MTEQQDPQRLEYKGFVGEYLWHEEDNCYGGHLLNISPDLVTFEGDNLDELEQGFKSQVDDYIEYIQEREMV